jgi:hypothetical protein
LLNHSIFGYFWDSDGAKCSKIAQTSLLGPL